MLENFNDYLSIFVVFIILFLTLWGVIYLINVKVIKKNLQNEIKYYGYDNDELAKKTKK